MVDRIPKQLEEMQALLRHAEEESFREGAAKGYEEGVAAVLDALKAAITEITVALEKRVSG